MNNRLSSKRDQHLAQKQRTRGANSGADLEDSEDEFGIKAALFTSKNLEKETETGQDASINFAEIEEESSAVLEYFGNASENNLGDNIKSLSIGDNQNGHVKNSAKSKKPTPQISKYWLHDNRFAEEDIPSTDTLKNTTKMNNNGRWSHDKFSTEDEPSLNPFNKPHKDTTHINHEKSKSAKKYNAKKNLNSDSLEVSPLIENISNTSKLAIRIIRHEKVAENQDGSTPHEPVGLKTTNGNFVKNLKHNRLITNKNNQSDKPNHEEVKLEYQGKASLESSIKLSDGTAKTNITVVKQKNNESAKITKKLVVEKVIKQPLNTISSGTDLFISPNNTGNEKITISNNTPITKLLTPKVSSKRYLKDKIPEIVKEEGLIYTNDVKPANRFSTAAINQHHSHNLHYTTLQPYTDQTTYYPSKNSTAYLSNAPHTSVSFRSSISVQPMMTSNGQLVLMTENGLMVPANHDMMYAIHQKVNYRQNYGYMDLTGQESFQHVRPSDQLYAQRPHETYAYTESPYYPQQSYYYAPQVAPQANPYSIKPMIPVVTRQPSTHVRITDPSGAEIKVDGLKARASKK